MILFFNKKTGEILGTIEGRVHYPEHMKASISYSNIPDADIGRYIIGWEETEDGKRVEHNMHHWKHQLVLEDPKNPMRNKPHKMKIDKNGNVEDIEFDNTV